jgi:hypothetical protein
MTSGTFYLFSKLCLKTTSFISLTLCILLQTRSDILYAVRVPLSYKSEIYCTGTGKLRIRDTQFYTIGQCCGSEFFVADPNIFSSRISYHTDPSFLSRIQTFFHPGSRIIHEKRNATLHFSCFLSFQEHSLILSHS